MSVEEELRGVVALPTHMNRSLVDFARAVRVHLEEEQQKPNPDNALIALLCDAGRCAWELQEISKIIRGGVDWASGPDKTVAQVVKLPMRCNVGGHFYPGCEERGADFYTSDCDHGCGCWMGATRSGGPAGLDPLGECPNNKPVVVDVKEIVCDAKDTSEQAMIRAMITQPPQDKNMCDPKGTAFSREIGQMCPKCGRMMTPIFMGNVLEGYRCGDCGYEAVGE